MKPIPISEREHLTLAEAAAYLGISSKTFKRHIEPLLKVSMFTQKLGFFSRTEIDQVINARKIDPDFDPTIGNS